MEEEFTKIGDRLVVVDEGWEVVGMVLEILTWATKGLRWESLYQVQVGEGEDQRFSLVHVQFEIALRLPCGNVHWIAGMCETGALKLGLAGGITLKIHHWSIHDS